MAKLSSTHIYGDLSVDSAITENGQLLSSKYAAASHGTHLTLGTGSGNAYRGDRGNTAYTHSQAAHAPSNAQKNSDITKAEIEAKLTGNITSHTHSYSLNTHGHSNVVQGSNDSRTTNQDGNANDLTASGFYRVSNSNSTSNPLPDGMHAHILHGQHPTGTFSYQIGFPYANTARMFFRINDSDAWGGWHRVYHTGNKPTLSELGAAAGSHTHSYLPLSGGTMTGKITTPNNAQGITIGDDVTICDRNIADHLVLEGSTATNGGITFGSGKDTNIYRGGANLLKTDDTMNAVGGFQWNGQSLDSRYAASSHTHNNIVHQDTRDVNTTPDGAPVGLSVHLKNNGKDGLSDGELYHSSLFIKGWDDHSGGPYGNIAISANNNLWYRASSSGTAWNSWKKVSVDGHTHSYAASSHNHTSLTGVTSLAFATHTDDSASITTSVSGNSSYMDFNMSDDAGSDMWRWRFTAWDGSAGAAAPTFNAMTLVPTTPSKAQLQVRGDLISNNGSNGGIWTNGGLIGLATSDGSKFQACFRVASSRGCCDLGHDTLAGQLTIRSGQGTAGSAVSIICAVTDGGNYMQYLSPEAGTIALTRHLSDRTKKENIVYIDSDDSEFTTKDFYNFVKDDLGLATYNLKEEYAATDTHTKLNFIAQDILWNFEKNEENKVGNLIVQAEKAMEEQGSLQYDPDNYVSVLAGALKEAINKIEELENKNKKLEERLAMLEEKFSTLKNK